MNTDLNLSQIASISVSICQKTFQRSSQNILNDMATFGWTKCRPKHSPSLHMSQWTNTQPIRETPQILNIRTAKLEQSLESTLHDRSCPWDPMQLGADLWSTYSTHPLIPNGPCAELFLRQRCLGTKKTRSPQYHMGPHTSAMDLVVSLFPPPTLPPWHPVWKEDQTNEQGSLWKVR